MSFWVPTVRGSHGIKYIRYAVTLTAPLVYFAFTMSYTRGPSFASSDEGGYLSWAKIIAGRTSPIGSPVYPGYGILLSPLYVVFDNPEAIWSGVIFVNSLLCFGSLILAQKLHLLLDPGATEIFRLSSLVVVASYPMFGTMMGYAFPSIPSTFFLLAAIVLIKPVLERRIGHTVGFTLVTAFLSLIHPTHLVFVCFAVWLLAHTRSTALARIAHPVGLISLVLFGQRVLKPFLFSQVLGNSSEVTLGYSFNSRFFSGLSEGSRYWNFIRELATLSFSLVIATLGLVVIVFLAFANYIKRQRPLSHEPQRFMILLGIIVPLVGYTVLTAHGFGFVPNSTYFEKRIEEHVFLRYVEPALIPTLVAGVVCFPLLKLRRFRLLVVALSLATVGVGGVILSHAIDTKRGLDGALGRIDYLSFMANGFWPASIHTTPSGQAWTILGLLMIVVPIFRRHQLLAIGMPALLAIVLPIQRSNYLWFFESYSRPSQIAEVVRASWTPSSCVAFDSSDSSLLLGKTDSYQWIQFGNFAAQFPNHRFELMDRSSWRRRCDGPLITFTPQFDNDQLVLFDSRTLAFLVSHSFKDLRKVSRLHFDLIASSGTNDPCIRNGCFGYGATELKLWSEVGVMTDNRLTTTGHKGRLITTPGNALNAGSYFLEIIGNFPNRVHLNIRFLSDDDRNVIVPIERPTYSPDLTTQRTKFSINRWVSDFKVVIDVGSQTNIKISGIRIVSQDQ